MMMGVAIARRPPSCIYSVTHRRLPRNHIEDFFTDSLSQLTKQTIYTNMLSLLASRPPSGSRLGIAGGFIGAYRWSAW